MNTAQPHLEGSTAGEAIQRGAALGDVRTELESELRGLVMAARMHGYFIAPGDEGKLVVMPLPGGAT